MAYRVSTQQRGGGTVHGLHDDETGASAFVLPAFGFNLFDLRLPIAGTVRAVLDSADNWADQPRAPGGHGTPVLFPFPNRIREGRYHFEGTDYQLPTNLPPNAIHGFAIQANWDVIDHAADDQGAHITGRYQISRQSPEMEALWPSDAILQMRYRLAHGRLSLHATVSNPTANALPWGFGIHPYFRLPFEPDGDPHRTRVVLPAREYWVLEDLLPTGERRPVDDRLDFRDGQPVAGLQLDDVLTGLVFDGDHATCRLIDQNLNGEFRLRIDPNFRELVVYTPPGGRRAIAVEPYTQATDAINLNARGIDAGLRVLGHDEQVELTLLMEGAASDA